jgi:hypothetical protein
MLKVEVAGYFVGKARDLTQAEDMAMDYVEWLDSTGKLDLALAVGGSVTIPFVFKENGRVVFEGDARIDVHSSVKGGAAGVANP